MEKNSKIYIAGDSGMVGSAISRNLKSKGYNNIVTGSHARLDLRDQRAVSEFFAAERPEYVFLAAAKVGGIAANNTLRAEFIFDNLAIETNVIDSAWRTGVKKLLFLGSSCVYPKDVPQPICEEALLTAPLEYTNEPYAIAKIAGLKMCESYNLQYGTNFISVMPTNLYGIGDNFDLRNSHVLPALLRRLHLATLLECGDWDSIRRDLDKRPIDGATGNAPEAEILKTLASHGIIKGNISIWGSGKPLREFMWCDDMADASVFLMGNIDFEQLKPSTEEVRNCHINIGTGEEISIGGLAQKIAQITGFTGEITYDRSKPDGMMRKLIDSSKLHNLGWRHTTSLDGGLAKFYTWYKI